MKFLLVVFLFVSLTGEAFAQNNTEELIKELPFRINLNGSDLKMNVTIDSLTSIIDKSCNDTIKIHDLSDQKYFKVISCDITIYHKGMDSIGFHTNGVFSEKICQETMRCRAGDLVFFDNIYIVEKGVRKKAPAFTLSFY